ncbi:ABC transporter permease [Staphylococcus intermedius]|uniref:Membrane spanning protein n=1 Tax=Staphylococcus intermedius NCTC 11048 TaxID=1141106 RepID=A0A380FXF0_STAIN|nr:ABC transporter permease [Staphylococcus intermedius]PCF83493.1 ABC transporter permease [Staphylococcus intermedius]PCF84099.1 ABC transporter permease [Staphylococcus intermedius]PNZ47978.1 ABC transporter permease [Staphylococcus intermedius NCTC 11048]SUM43559.1 membrane spanning protein [Staphylococcus intermedius NCTC 11048]
MGTLINQELYKIFKKKSSIIIPVIIFALMIAMAVLSNNYEDILKPESQFKQGYTGFSWIFFLMIIQAATIITMEFHYGTIKNLLYRNYSRMSIILSKFIALFIYSLALFIVTTLITLGLKLILFSDMDILKQSGDNLSLLQEHLLTGLATYIGMWLILSLTLLISCLLKSPGVSIAVGIVFYFASSVISVILFAAIDQWEWLKWNPINMLNLSTQVLDNEVFKKMTKLELHELYIGNIIYIIIFLALVIYAFKKKNV